MAELFPRDTQILPVSRGALLVSPGHAIFCPLSPAELPQVRRALEGADVDLPVGTVSELERHGFGGPPRDPKPPAPSVQLQLTNDCNLACTYCCTNSGEARTTEVNRDQLFAVVDQVVEVHGPGTRVGILGGEPLLVPWALDLSERIVDLGLLHTLFTNGTMIIEPQITPRVARLIEGGAQVRVSLAGTSRSRCDAQSGVARFDRAIAGINALSDLGALPIVDLMLLPEDADYVAETMHDLRKLLPRGIKIALGILYLAGREEGEHLFRSRADLETVLDRISFEAGEVIEVPAPAPVAFRREGCTCALGHHLHIRSDGSLFTCFKMEEKVGHLEDMSFTEALDRLLEQARPATMLAACESCPFVTLCGGGCRTENLQFTGDAEDPACGSWRVQVLAELLAEDRVTALEWPVTHLLSEAKSRGIDSPETITPARRSRHLWDV